MYSESMSTITPIPSVPEFKKAFIERYSELTDWDEFKKYSLSFLRRSIRINTLTTTIKETKKSIEAKVQGSSFKK